MGSSLRSLFTPCSSPGRGTSLAKHVTCSALSAGLHAGQLSLLYVQHSWHWNTRALPWPQPWPDHPRATYVRTLWYAVLSKACRVMCVGEVKHLCVLESITREFLHSLLGFTWRQAQAAHRADARGRPKMYAICLMRGARTIVWRWKGTKR